jgi:hypothetical protein
MSVSCDFFLHTGRIYSEPAGQVLAYDLLPGFNLPFHTAFRTAFFLLDIAHYFM